MCEKGSLGLHSFTSDTNNSPTCFNTSVSKSPAAGRTLHQCWPRNTNRSWQGAARKLAGKNHLFVVSKQVCSGHSEEEGLNHNSSCLHSDGNPKRGGWSQLDMSWRPARVPQRGENKLVGQVVATELNGSLLSLHLQYNSELLFQT